MLVLGVAGPSAWGQSFGGANSYNTGGGDAPYAVAVGDLNGDGRPDIATVHMVAGTLVVLPGQPSGSWGPANSRLIGAGSNPTNVALADLNADGRPDVVTTNIGTHTASVQLALAGGGLAPATAYSVGALSSPYGLALGDVTGDGRPDIVTANIGTTVVAVLPGLASGGFGPLKTYSTGVLGYSPYAVALGDVNGDGRPDVATANYYTNTVAVLLAQPAGGFGGLVNYSTGPGSYPHSIALGDINHDGRLDILSANTGSGSAGVLLGLAGGGFGPVSHYATGPGSAPVTVALGDVNGDHNPDVVVTNGASDNVGVLLGLGNGQLGPATTYATGTGSKPGGLALADMNGDGRPDIVTANYGNNSVGVLLNTGTYTPLATARLTATDFTLAPNPARDGFTVQLPAAFNPTQAELLNSLGQVVRRPAVSSAANFRVETRGLAPGLYTLRLLAGGAALVRRVVVE